MAVNLDAKRQGRSPYKSKRQQGAKPKQDAEGKRKRVYLHMHDCKAKKELEDGLHKLGWVVEKFFSKDIDHLIYQPKKPSTQKGADGGTGLSRAAGLGPSPSAGSPLAGFPENQLMTRGQVMVLNSRPMEDPPPGVLDQAKIWGIKVIEASMALGKVRNKLEERKPAEPVQKKPPPESPPEHKTLSLNTFIKVEHSNLHSPSFCEMDRWPRLDPKGRDTYEESRIRGLPYWAIQVKSIADQRAKRHKRPPPIRPELVAESKVTVPYPTTSSGPAVNMRHPPSATVSKATVPLPTTSSEFIIHRHPSATVSKATVPLPTTSSGPAEFIIRRQPSATVSKATVPLPTTSSGPAEFIIRRQPSATVSAPRHMVSSSSAVFATNRAPSATVSVANKTNERQTQYTTKLLVQPAARPKKRVSCELCHTKYENLEEHLQTEMHISNVQDRNKWMRLQKKVHNSTDFFQRLQTDPGMADPASLPYIEWDLHFCSMDLDFDAYPQNDFLPTFSNQSHKKLRTERGSRRSSEEEPPSQVFWPNNLPDTLRRWPNAMDTSIRQLQMEPRQEFHARFPSAPAPIVKERALLPSDRQSTQPKQQMVFGPSQIGSLRVLGAQRQLLPSFIESGTSETQGTPQTHNPLTVMPRTSGVQASMQGTSKMPISQASVLELPRTSGVQASMQGTSKMPISQASVLELPGTSGIQASMQGISKMPIPQRTVLEMPKTSGIHISSQGTSEKLISQTTVPGKPQPQDVHESSSSQGIEVGSPVQRMVHYQGTAEQPCADMMAETEKISKTDENLVKRYKSKDDKTEKKPRTETSKCRRAAETSTAEDLVVEVSADAGETHATKIATSGSTLKAPTLRETTERQSKRKGRPKRKASQPLNEDNSIGNEHWGAQMLAAPDLTDSPEGPVVQETAGDGSTKEGRKVEGPSDSKIPRKQLRRKRRGKRTSGKSNSKEHSKEDETENLAAEPDQADSAETPVVEVAMGDGNSLKDKAVEDLVEGGESARQTKPKGKRGRRASRKLVARDPKGGEAENLAAEVSADLAERTAAPMGQEAVDEESTMKRTPKSSLPEEIAERKLSNQKGRPRRTVSLTEDSIGTEICKAQTSADPGLTDSAEASVEQVAAGDGSTMEGRKVEKPESKETAERQPGQRGRRGRKASRRSTAVDLKEERIENTAGEVSAELDPTDLAKTPVVPETTGVESTMKDQTVKDCVDNETGERKSRRRGRPRKKVSKESAVVDSKVDKTGISTAEPDETDSVKPSAEQVSEESNTETKKNEDFPEGAARGRRASRRLRAVEPEMEAVEDSAVPVAAGPELKDTPRVSAEQERPYEEINEDVRSLEDKVHEEIPEKQPNPKGGRGRKRSRRQTTVDLESESGEEKGHKKPAREDSNLGSASANAQGPCAGPSLVTVPGDLAEENANQERTQENEAADEDKEEASKKTRPKRSRKCHQKSSSRIGEDEEQRRKDQGRSSTATVPADEIGGEVVRVTRQGRRQPLRVTQMTNQGRTRAVADLSTESRESPSIPSPPVMLDVTSNSDSRRNAFMAQVAKTYPSLEKTVTNSAQAGVAVELEDTMLTLATTVMWNTPESTRRRTECLETLTEEAVRTENFSHTTTVPAAPLSNLYEASTSPYTEPAEYAFAFEDDCAGGKEETNSEGVSEDYSRRLAEVPTVTDASKVEHLLLQEGNPCGLQMNTDEIKHPVVHEEIMNLRRAACGARRGLHYDESGGLVPSLQPVAGQQSEDISFFSSHDGSKPELPEERSVEPQLNIAPLPSSPCPQEAPYSDLEHCSSATALDAQFLGRVEKGAELLMDEKHADADNRATVLENKRESVQQKTAADFLRMNSTDSEPHGKKRRRSLQGLSLSPNREGAQKAAKMAAAFPESQKEQEQSIVNNDKRSPLKMVLVADPQRRRKSFSIRPKTLPASAQIPGSLEARNSNLALQSFEESQDTQDEMLMKLNLIQRLSAPAETEATATQLHRIGEQSLPEALDASTMHSMLGDSPQRRACRPDEMVPAMESRDGRQIQIVEDQSCAPHLAKASTASSPADHASHKAQQRKSQESSSTSNTPSRATSTTPSSATSTTPSSVTSTTPSSVTSTTPSSATSTTPSSATPTTPSSAASTTPSSAASTTPSSAASTTPSSAASTTPSSATPTTPSSAASNTPSSATSNTPSCATSNAPSSASNQRKRHSTSGSDFAADTAQYSARMSSTGLKVVLSRSDAAKRSRHSSGYEFEPATPKQRVTNKSQKASNFSSRLDETLREPPSSDEFAADPFAESLAARSASQKKLRKHKYKQIKKPEVKTEEGQEHIIHRADARETEDKDQLVEPENAPEVRIREMDDGHCDIPVNTNVISVGDHGHEIKVEATGAEPGSLDDENSSLMDFDVYEKFQPRKNVPHRRDKSKNATPGRLKTSPVKAVKLEQTPTSPSPRSGSQTIDSHAKLSTGRQSLCQDRENQKFNELDSSNPGTCKTSSSQWASLTSRWGNVTTSKYRDISSQADLQSNEQMRIPQGVPAVSRHAPPPSLPHEQSGGCSSAMVARGRKRKCYDPIETNSPKVRHVLQFPSTPSSVIKMEGSMGHPLSGILPIKEDPDEPSMGRPEDRDLFFDSRPAASTSRVVLRDLSAKNFQSQHALPLSASLASAKLPSHMNFGPVGGIPTAAPSLQNTGHARAPPKFTMTYHKRNSRAKQTSRVRQANIIANQRDVQLVLVHPDKKAELIKKSS